MENTTITQIIKNDHNVVLDLYKQYQESGNDEKKQNVANDILDELLIHAEMEEKLFYPEMREDGEEVDKIVEAETEHQTVKIMIAKLKTMKASEENFDGNMTALMDSVQHHVREEENDLIPHAEKLIPEERLEELGDRAEEMKTDLKGSSLKHLWESIKT